ncbi:GNAT family N-acetyltransferase [Amphibacillus sp. MSJ-3]|uniref:GNAT family N-acetyltransferase n=1 Tax=Amphibacillus sp. MSJ-3 TaxID=2841505 RepID=UPI001C0EB99A|nr:GNAT family N-acetyltransferase [Amphibacillus sp. MSJ-3]MBU5594268.1 GNAT family N-acetyltransferase [Amphibacillus sp. MSJ-3]
MLIRYKKSMEKIAMGLLSFMPEEKDVKKLQHTMKAYEENENWHLYLWRENDDVLGAIGVEINQIDATVTVQHISVNPSHRELGIGHKMINEIREIYEENYQIIANDLTESFLNKCE